MAKGKTGRRRGGRERLESEEYRGLVLCVSFGVRLGILFILSLSLSVGALFVFDLDSLLSILIA